MISENNLSLFSSFASQALHLYNRIQLFNEACDTLALPKNFLLSLEVCTVDKVNLIADALLRDPIIRSMPNRTARNCLYGIREVIFLACKSLKNEKIPFRDALDASITLFSLYADTLKKRHLSLACVALKIALFCYNKADPSPLDSAIVSSHFFLPPEIQPVDSPDTDDLGNMQNLISQNDKSEIDKKEPPFFTKYFDTARQAINNYLFSALDSAAKNSEWYDRKMHRAASAAFLNTPNQMQAKVVWYLSLIPTALNFTKAQIQWKTFRFASCRLLQTPENAFDDFQNAHFVPDALAFLQKHLTASGWLTHSNKA